MVHTPNSDNSSFLELAFPTNSLRNAVRSVFIDENLAGLNSICCCSIRENISKMYIFQSNYLFIKRRFHFMTNKTYNHWAGSLSFHSMADVDIFGFYLNIQRIGDFECCAFISRILSGMSTISSEFFFEYCSKSSKSWNSSPISSFCTERDFSFSCIKFDSQFLAGVFHIT